MNLSYEEPRQFNAVAAGSKTAQTEAVMSRQAQEVQAAMVVAKRFPRDENEAFNRIMTACRRKSLAEQSQYEYPRGKQKVTGPSIRLAEVLARAWGNIDFGVIELEQTNGESQVMAYAWDLETNTRQTKVFTVRHERGTKQGNQKLSDPRDIYEIVANQGARRVRACILGIIPGDVTEAAIAECNQTLISGNKEPLSDRIRKTCDAFADKFNVSKEMLEKYMGCPATAWSEMDIIRLGKTFISLRDGMAKREELFDLKTPSATAAEKTNTELEFEALKAEKNAEAQPE